MSELVLHKLSQAQKAIVLDMLRAAALALKDQGISQWEYWLDPPESKLKWLEEGIVQGQFYLVQKESEKVGIVRIMEEDLLYWGKQDVSALYIHSLVILPKWKGLGFGSKVIDQIASIASEKNITRLRLDCVSNNQKLCQYYQNLDFQKVGTVQMPLSENTLFEKIL